MSIHFDNKRWDCIKDTYGKWWEHKLDRPLYKYVITNAYVPNRERPKAKALAQSNVNDLSVTPEEIVDVWDYQLECCEFLGDSFPYINFACFGPGIVSAFCGARLDNSSGRVWLFPPEEKDIKDISIKYDPNNIWARRVKDICRAGMERWQGSVLMATPDLGGNFDIVAVMRGTQELLMDLYDEPEEVERLLKEADKAWFDAFEDINAILHPKNGPQNPGYSDWEGVFSSTPSYVLQSDFSYSISTDMFKEFTMPHLEYSINKLDHTIYHLDGIGQLNHLDTLLQNEKLGGIQWVPGQGKAPVEEWIDVYKKIEAAGKGSHIIGSVQSFPKVEKEVKRNLYFSGSGSKEGFEKNKIYIEKYI